MWDHENVHVISTSALRTELPPRMPLIAHHKRVLAVSSGTYYLDKRYIQAPDRTNWKDSTTRVQEVETMLSLSSMSHQSRLVAQTISL